MISNKINLLYTSRLGASYASAFCIKDISFELNAGDFLTLIGPNGSGKTTLLRCLTGAFKNYSGSIKILSQEIKTIPSKKLARLMTLTMQNSIRPNQLKVFPYILLGRYPWLGYLGFFNKNDYICASECGQLCKIVHLFDREVGDLSAGEWQKVILARALCQIWQAPKSILALDEISSAMDPAKSIETFHLLSNLCKRSCAIIAAVHDCNLAALFATHILALKNGKIQFYGRTQEVFTKENLAKLYDMPLGIFKHPQLGLPQIYPLLHTSNDITNLSCPGGAI